VYVSETLPRETLLITPAQSKLLIILVTASVQRGHRGPFVRRVLALGGHRRPFVRKILALGGYRGPFARRVLALVGQRGPFARKVLALGGHRDPFVRRVLALGGHFRLIAPACRKYPNGILRIL